MNLIKKMNPEKKRNKVTEDVLELARTRGEIARETDQYQLHHLVKYADRLKSELNRYGVSVN